MNKSLAKNSAFNNTFAFASVMYFFSFTQRLNFAVVDFGNYLNRFLGLEVQGV